LEFEEIKLLSLVYCI